MALPARPELVAHGQAGLQVGQVVAGQDGHGGGAGQADRLQRLRQGGVRDDHRHAEGPGLAEMPVAVVLLDHDHVAARGDQPGRGLHAHRAQADDQHVAAQPGDPLPAQRLLDAAADQHVGEHGEEHRDEQGAEQHQHDGPAHQPRALSDGGEVAVVHRGDRLHGEVHGVQQRDMVPAQPVGQPQDHRGRDDHAEQREQRGDQAAVHGLQQGGGQVPRGAHAAGEPARRAGGGGQPPAGPERTGPDTQCMAMRDHPGGVQFPSGVPNSVTPSPAATR